MGGKNKGGGIQFFERAVRRKRRNLSELKKVFEAALCDSKIRRGGIGRA